MDGKSLRKPHLVTPNPRGPSPGNTEEMVGKEKGTWEKRERRVWEQPHPRKEVRNPREGTKAFPHGFHMVSAWLSRISIYRGLTQAEKRRLLFPRGIPPRNFLPFPSESVPSEQKFPRGPSLEKDISLLQENLCGIPQHQFCLGST